MANETNNINITNPENTDALRPKLQIEQMRRMTTEEYKQSPKTPLVIVADEIRSLNNVGSLFRTADSFRLQSLVLCGITGTPPNPEIHKTALGAEYSVDWVLKESTLEAVRELKAQGYVTLALEQAVGSVMLQDLKVDPEAKYALVIGNEVHGVKQQVVDECDVCVEIPQFGTKHSLNVSVSTGIAIWEIVRHLRLGL